MTGHILLLRHAQTDANVAGILQGHLPTRLNAVGREQAKRLAARLVSYEPSIARLVSSDLPRALESAEPIAERLGLPVEVDLAFRERGYGVLEGVDPARREALRRSMDDGALGEEPVVAFEKRVLEALRGVVASLGSAPKEWPSPCVAVVTHGGVIRRVLRMLNDGRLPSRDTPPPLAPVLNASIFHLVWDGEAFRSAAFNDDRHLDPEGRWAIDSD
jgi:probable phosphoglycerate mutase